MIHQNVKLNDRVHRGDPVFFTDAYINLLFLYLKILVKKQPFAIFNSTSSFTGSFDCALIKRLEGNLNSQLQLLLLDR